MGNAYPRVTDVGLTNMDMRRHSLQRYEKRNNSKLWHADNRQTEKKNCQIRCLLEVVRMYVKARWWNAVLEATSLL